VGVDSPDKIPDEAITTNAPRPVHGANIGPDNVASLARLGNTGKPWFPASDSIADYVQYDLGEVRIIAAMKAQGAPHTGCGVGGNCPKAVMREFRLEYSRDGKSWVKLATKVGSATVFVGPLKAGQDITSKDNNDPEEYKFPSTSHPGLPSFEARFIRVYLVRPGYYGFSSIQMEFYGPQCQAAATVSVGIASMALTDSAMTQNVDYQRSVDSHWATRAPEKGRLNSGTHFVIYHQPAPVFQNKLWLQVDVGRLVSIGAVATQGRADDHHWVTKYKLGGSSDGTSFTVATGVLQGNTDETKGKMVVKNYVTPFEARYVRLYIWESSMTAGSALRMELYAVATNFAWLDSDSSAILGDHTFAGAIGSNAFCNLTMIDLTPSFQAWTEGMNGDGTIYESAASTIQLSGTEYSVTALQRSTVKFLGIMSKQMVCFEANSQERCCVNKESKLLGRGPWNRQAAEIKMS
jgi:hypothetical protein